MLSSLIQVCIVSMSLSATAQLNAQDCATNLQVAQAKKGKVLLNYEAAELVDVVTTMSKLTGKIFVVEDQVRTRRITIISATKVSVEEAYQAFLASLKAEGLKIEKTGKFYKIRRKSHSFFRSSSKKGCPSFEGITQVNATTYKIPKSVQSVFSTDTACAGKDVRIVPIYKNGITSGFKLKGIRKGSLFAKLGFKNGDIIYKIDGLHFDTLEKVMELYNRLRKATKFEVDVIRRGDNKKLTYQLEK
jgi:type II secretion system protein C